MPNAPAGNATTNVARIPSRTYLKAILKDGTEIVSGFEKLANVQKYAAQVFARVNTFNAWQLVSRVHPTSGEPCLVRHRRMISGDQIVEMIRVVPISFTQFGATMRDQSSTDLAEVQRQYDTAIENYDPSVFEAALEIQSGEGGTWVAPAENTPEGAVAGMRYPVHIEPSQLGRFVILRVATETSPEIRFQLEANRATSEATIDELTGGRIVDEVGPTDGDDDIDPDERA